MSLGDRIRGCPPDGALRALIDGEGDPLTRGHVDVCVRCAQRLARLTDTVTGVATAMDWLSTDSRAADPTTAYRRFNATRTPSHRRFDSTGGSWMRDIWTRPRTRAVAALATVVVLMLAVSFSPMATVANDFLNQFRVQKFAAITIPVNLSDPGKTALFETMTHGDHSEMSSQFSALGSFDTTFNVNKDTMPAALTVDQAAAEYGGMQAPTTLPGGYDAAPQAFVTKAGSASYTLNVDEAKGIISRLNLPIYAFDSVTSPTLTFGVDVPAAAILHYQNAAGENLVVGQMESPQLNIPSELNVNALREDILRFPALPADLAAQLRAVKDWKETLIIPIPEGATSEDVTVDGHAGLLIKSDQGNGVIWQADGKLYAVAGQVSADQVMATAKSMAAVH